MDNYSRGIYILQIFADEAAQDRPSVVQAFLDKYGREQVESIGKMGAGVNFGVLRDRLRQAADGATDKSSPSRADITTALLQAGAQLPSGAEIVGQAVSDTAKQVGEAASFGLKGLLVIAVIGGAGYLAWQMGWLKRVLPRKG